MSIVDRKYFSGFSIIELVVVVLLLGILSVFAIGRLFDQNQFAARGFFDDTVNAVRFAQKLALSSGCDVRVSLTAGGYVLNQRATSCELGAFTRAVPNPANRATNYQNIAPDELIVPEVEITFNSRGLPVAAGDIAVTMTGPGANYNFRVFAETGLVDV
ncbi:MAG: prepilin-type N-terminal cleavage/methylation domain-containing protein [Gammaproteobacteria bacterium]|nr:prepilin-type N-terminal cleavage/methylation domain-containing protein [Gammaproteobacteria bacterium]